MVECSRFLEGYTAFRDGELDNWELEEFESHLQVCASCARYHQVIERGVTLYRSAGELTPSEDFLPRLQHRLYHVEDEIRTASRSSSGTSAMLTLGIAALIAAAAWLPALRSAPAMLELPPVMARAPLPPPVEPGLLFQRGPFLVREAPRIEWGETLVTGGSRDLLFRYSPAGSPYQVQPVSRY